MLHIRGRYWSDLLSPVRQCRSAVAGKSLKAMSFNFFCTALNYAEGYNITVRVCCGSFTRGSQWWRLRSMLLHSRRNTSQRPPAARCHIYMTLIVISGFLLFSPTKYNQTHNVCLDEILFISGLFTTLIEFKISLNNAIREGTKM